MHAIMTRRKTVSLSQYKGESFIRYRLYFKIWLFKWSIIYDLTMFDDWKSYTDLWDGMIKNRSKIKISAIKANKIF